MLPLHDPKAPFGRIIPNPRETIFSISAILNYVQIRRRKHGGENHTVLYRGFPFSQWCKVCLYTMTSFVVVTVLVIDVSIWYFPLNILTWFHWIRRNINWEHFRHKKCESPRVWTHDHLQNVNMRSTDRTKRALVKILRRRKENIWKKETILLFAENGFLFLYISSMSHSLFSFHDFVPQSLSSP